MFGIIAYHTTEMPPVQVIDGVRFRTVPVTRGQSLRARFSARTAAGKLRRERVRYALFPTDYPHCALFARGGILPPPLAPLFRAAAPAIVRRYMATRGLDPHAAMVAFAARRVTPELRRCVTGLCGEIRYLALCVPDGGEALARTMRRDCGAAVRVGTPDALPHPDLTVVFDDMPVSGETLRLDETLAVSFDSPRSNALLALLYSAGALDAASLNVTSLTCCETT